MLLKRYFTFYFIGGSIPNPCTYTHVSLGKKLICCICAQTQQVALKWSSLLWVWERMTSVVKPCKGLWVKKLSDTVRKESVFWSTFYLFAMLPQVLLSEHLPSQTLIFWSKPLKKCGLGHFCVCVCCQIFSLIPDKMSQINSWFQILNNFLMINIFFRIYCPRKCQQTG